VRRVLAIIRAHHVQGTLSIVGQGHLPSSIRSLDEAQSQPCLDAVREKPSPISSCPYHGSFPRGARIKAATGAVVLAEAASRPRAPQIGEVRALTPATTPIPARPRARRRRSRPPPAGP